MSDANLKDQLCDRFGSQVAADDALLQECIKICNLYNLTAEELQYKWEAFSFNGSSRALTLLTLESAGLLKANIQRSLANEKIKKEKEKTGRSFGGFATAGRGTSKFAGPTKFGGVAKGRLGGESRSLPTNASYAKSRVAFKCYPEGEEERNKRAYKYMYEKISERSETLDDRIDEFAEIIRRRHQIADFGDPSATTEDRVYVVGRITLDAESSTTGAVKLNAASLVLETSRGLGSGARAAIKFHTGTIVRGEAPDLTNAGFFPGAICAFKGKNGGGGWFLADEILTVPSLSRPDSVKSEGGLGSFDMCIACGPFTSDADLDYKPWHSLVRKLKAARPAVLLLVGPFVDAAHPLVKVGDVDATYAEIFGHHFRDHITDLLDLSPGSMVIIVPHVRDLLSDHAVYPQPEFTSEVFADPRVHMVPNPCQFSVNGINFATTSADVLFHLRKEEFIKTSATAAQDSAADPLANACRHLLQQRSFYPIFPVPVDHTAEINLDVSHSSLLQLGGVEATAPDVLILPSRLKYFTKIIDGTTAINPSTVHKGQYSHLIFDASVLGSDRVSVQNLKID